MATEEETGSTIELKVSLYQQTKFRRHISINGWNLTTSVLEKQTTAIL